MSAPAPHRIQRLVVELQGCPPAQAAALQAALHRLLQRDWLPAIGQLLDAQDAAGAVRRIDRLACQLPPLSAEALLEAARPGADAADSADAAVSPAMAFDGLSAALAPALADALDQAETVDVDAELLTQTLHDGLLPWWADPNDAGAVPRAAAALLARPGAAWRRLLGPATADAAPLRRLAALLDGPQQAALLARLCSDDGAPAGAEAAWPAALAQAWQAALADAAGALGLAPAALQSAWWRAAVAAALPQPPGPPAVWLPAVLDRVAVAQSVDAERLRAALRQALDRPAAGAAAAPLWPALAAARGPQAAADGRLADAADRLALALRRLAAAGADAAAWAALLGGWAALPAALRARLRAAFDAAVADAAHGASPAGAAGGRPDTAGRPGASDRLGQPGQPEPRGRASADRPAGPATGATGRGVAASAGQQALGLLAEALRAAWSGLGEAARRSGRPAPAPHGAADADRLARALRDAGQALPGAAAVPAPAARPRPETVAIGNAGLVLLWPFLPRFTEHLGLRVDGAWRDADAPWQAARLLQCLASGDRAPPEVLLPLNKLLCGLPLDAPMDAAPALDDHAVAACEDLLRAVVAQSGALGEMSANALRGNFLLRPGQLGGRDGHWLLQVERRAWDLLIARFPWSIEVVRLPWMPVLLQVQW